MRAPGRCRAEVNQARGETRKAAAETFRRMAATGRPRSSLAARPITRPDEFACQADKDWMIHVNPADDGRKPDG